ATLAPCAAKASNTARPMPDAPPVTRTTLPVSRAILTPFPAAPPSRRRRRTRRRARVRTPTLTPRRDAPQERMSRELERAVGRFLRGRQGREARAARRNAGDGPRRTYTRSHAARRRGLRPHRPRAR